MKKRKSKSDPLSRIPSNPYSFAVGDTVYSEVCTDFFEVLEIDSFEGVPEGALLTPARFDPNAEPHRELLADLLYIRTPGKVSYVDEFKAVLDEMKTNLVKTLSTPTPLLPPEFKVGGRVTFEGDACCVFLITELHSSFGVDYADVDDEDGSSYTWELSDILHAPEVRPTPPSPRKFMLGDRVEFFDETLSDRQGVYSVVGFAAKYGVEYLSLRAVGVCDFLALPVRVRLAVSPRFCRDDRVTSFRFPDDLFAVLSSQASGDGFIVYLISDAGVCRFIAEDDLVLVHHKFSVGDRVTVLDDCDLCGIDEVFVITSIQSSFGDSYAFVEAANGLTHAEDFENLRLVAEPPVAPALFPSKFNIGDNVLIDGCTEIVYFVDSVANHSDGTQVVFLEGPGHCSEFDVDPARLSVATISVASAKIPDDSTATAPANDSVNHPAHYTSDPSGVECWQITRHRSFNIGNAFKYLWRAGLKGSNTSTAAVKHIEDLHKAVAYINDEIELLEGNYNA